MPEARREIKGGKREMSVQFVVASWTTLGDYPFSKAESKCEEAFSWELLCTAFGESGFLTL